MPRKLAKEPKTMILMIKNLREKYGHDILSRAINRRSGTFYPKVI